MAITAVGTPQSTGVSSAGTSLTITKPSGLANGDILIANVTADSTTPTPPSGWATVDGGLHPSASWTNFVYYKVISNAGTEPANYTWTVGNVGPAAGIITAWRGVNTSNPIPDYVDDETTTSSEPNTGPSVTATVATGRLFYIRHIRQSVGDGTGSVANLTEAVAGITRLDNDGGVSSSGNTSYTCAIFAADADFSGTGSKSGLAVSCNITEAHNYEATFVLAGQAVTDASAGFMTTTPSLTTNKPTASVGARPTVIG
jgi:hypothetical protein